MKAPSKITGFLAALAAVFVLSFGAGAVLGPDEPAPPATHNAETHDADTPPPTEVATAPMPSGHGH
ncbi:hypothetical protein AB0P13_08480 [Rhodococcus pyridinivorans]|uniref:hypothetical protein n=1 Tax=Rhodococcus pyridinivorans TaxID=103816 RepID=UPI000BA21A9D|nr:hypothetical protein [Rhodococcus pyridinivorans]UPK62005.1 hypothetical protein MYP14_14250 [Rhodococcus pyridinivorans]